MNQQKSIINIVLDRRAIIGIIISVGGIYWAFKDFQFQEFANSIQKVNYLYLLLATVILWVSVWFRAIRWRWLFRIETLPSTVSLYRAVLMGYFGNNVLPLRLGELMRAYLIGREWNLSKSYVFGTIVLERILDTITLFLFSFLLIIVYPLEGSLIKTIIWISCLTIMAIFILWIILHHLKNIKGNHRLINGIKQMIDGVLSIKKDVILPVILISILIWSIYCLDVYLLQYAFGFELSFPQILMVLVFSSLALSIPSAPGMIGTYHAAIKYTIVDLFGFASHVGSSFAIFMHAYGYILFTVLGAYHFMKNQFYNNTIQTIIDTELNQETS